MPVSVRIWSKRLLTVAAIAGTGAFMFGTGADAAPKKPSAGKDFSFVAKSPEIRGATDSAYTLTLTNLTGTQQLGSANIVLPSGLSIFPANLDLPPDPVANPPRIELDAATAARGGRWAVNGATLELRDLNTGPAAPSNTVTVTIDAHMPCTGDLLSYSGGVFAKQSNDFSSMSQDGNQLTLAKEGNTLATALQGSCTLSFLKQPGTTEKGTQIRAAELAPTSEELVTVRAFDGANQLMTWFDGPGAPVTLTPNHDGFTAESTQTVEADHGVAEFDNIVIANAGLYTLNASAEGAAGSSNEFTIPVFVRDCVVGNCSFPKQLGGDGTSLTLTGLPSVSGGKLVLSPNLGAAPPSNCGNNYKAPSSDFYEIKATEAIPMTAEISYGKANVRNAGGQSALKVCFASPVDFVADGGTQDFDYNGNGPGTAGHAGVLFNCPSSGERTQPCVAGSTGSSGGGAIVTVYVPALWHDPRLR